MPVGARTRLGRQPIIVTPRSAVLEDGTLAGSILTMDAAFRLLVQRLSLGPVAASRMCASTPASELGLQDTGRLAPGCVADLAVLGPDLAVRRTYVSGVLAWEHSFSRLRLPT